ncbi:MAG: undecaprenyl-diphosphate phosphatase [Candidatus Fimimonas sp.]
MTVLESIFLGLLQGFTEFLPVSSSGHLMLAQKLFNIDAGLFFDVMLHLGTLLAVVIAMRKSLWQTLRHPVADKRLLYLVLASIPTFAIALLVKLFVSEQLMQKLLPVGFALTIVLIVLSDKLSKPKVRLCEANVLPPIVTGIVQGIAVFPGLSRSGATISTMKLFGVNASDSAEFSFLLSVPIILASAAVEIWEVAQTTISAPWYTLAVGVAAAFLSGLVSVKVVMRAVKYNRWIWFALYLAVPLILSLITL